MPSLRSQCPARSDPARPPRALPADGRHGHRPRTAPLAWPVPGTSGPDRQWLAECSGAALREALRAVAPELGGYPVTVPGPAGKQDPLWHSGSVPAGDRFFVKFARRRGRSRVYASALMPITVRGRVAVATRTRSRCSVICAPRRVGCGPVIATPNSAICAERLVVSVPNVVSSMCVLTDSVAVTATSSCSVFGYLMCRPSREPRRPVVPRSQLSSSRTRGMTWWPYSSMLVMSWSWVRPGRPYFRSNRVAPSARRFVAILPATVSGEPT
jgi:hypothetical protein